MRARSQDGFTLIEMSIALTLLLVGLLIAADLLMETAQIFGDVAGQANDTPVPLAVARIRSDVQGASSVFIDLTPTGAFYRLRLFRPDQQIAYTKLGDALYRTVQVAGSPPQKPAYLWRGVVGWSCYPVDLTRLIRLTVIYRRHATPRSPLPGMPGSRGAKSELLIQTMSFLPRGAGLGDSW